MTQCICPDADPYECWALRYHGQVMRNWNAIEADGGPCQCQCHERGEDDVKHEH